MRRVLWDVFVLEIKPTLTSLEFLDKLLNVHLHDKWVIFVTACLLPLLLQPNSVIRHNILSRSL